MARRAEPPPRGRGEARPRFEIDRTWLTRGILAVLAVALLLLIVKVSMMAFSGVGKRLERSDPGHVSATKTAREPAREAP